VAEELFENNREKSLTCIPSSYTVSGTNDEVEWLMIMNFLNTLAEIALSIASREVKE